MGEGMSTVVLLNYDYTFLNMISWKKAVKLLVKGKASVVKYSDSIIKNQEKTFEMFIPKVLRLVSYIKIIRKIKVVFTRRAVFLRDENTCVYCGKKGKQLNNGNVHITIDHVIPKSKGGRSEFENCVTSCMECNRKKNNKLPHEVGMKLRIKPWHPTFGDLVNSRLKLSGISMESLY